MGLAGKQQQTGQVQNVLRVAAQLQTSLPPQQIRALLCPLSDWSIRKATLQSQIRPVDEAIGGLLTQAVLP